MCKNNKMMLCLIIIMTQVDTSPVIIKEQQNATTNSILEKTISVLHRENNSNFSKQSSKKQFQEPSNPKKGSLSTATTNEELTKLTDTLVPNISIERWSKSSNRTVFKTTIYNFVKPGNTSVSNSLRDVTTTVLNKFNSKNLANVSVLNKLFKIVTIHQEEANVLLNISLENITTNALEESKDILKYESNKPKNNPKIARQNDLPFYFRPRPVIPINRYHQPEHNYYSESRIDRNREHHNHEEAAIARHYPSCDYAALPQCAGQKQTCQTAPVLCPTTTRQTTCNPQTIASSSKTTNCPTTQNPCGPPVIDLPENGVCPKWARCIETQFEDERGFGDPSPDNPRVENVPNPECRLYWRSNFNIPD